MGLKISTEIATSGGITSAAYLNIEKLAFSKNRACDVWVNLYLNEESRESNSNSTVLSQMIPRRFGISNQGSPSVTSLFSSETLYEVSYEEIKSVLESKGLVVVDSLS
jgi:hypothetical protein